MRPLVGTIRLSSSLNSVLLPAPLWPISPSSWPRGIARLTPSSAANAPYRLPSASRRTASSEVASTPGAPVGMRRDHARVGVDDAGDTQDRELLADQAQRLH